jgi:hypothetical protein
MNKKGMAGMFTFLLVEIIFIFAWAGGLGGVINNIGDNAVTSGGLTGLTAFFFANLNLLIFFALLISNVVVVANANQ